MYKFLAVGVLMIARCAIAMTFTVTNTNDSGNGSLRKAGAGNVIAFNGSPNRNSGGVGVFVGTGNSILGNSIFSNTGD